MNIRKIKRFVELFQPFVRLFLRNLHQRQLRAIIKIQSLFRMIIPRRNFLNGKEEQILRRQQEELKRKQLERLRIMKLKKKSVLIIEK